MKSGSGFGARTTIALTLAAILPLGAATSSAAAPQSTAQVGNDISFPQCGSTFPSDPAFGIVGVNDGVPDTLNPCLGPSSSFPSYSQSELYWAVSASTGSSSEPKASVYVNTSDPGNVFNGTLVANWPTSGATPYGTCTVTTVSTSAGPAHAGEDSPACAWEFGDQQATQDAAWLHAAAQAVDAQSPPVSVPATPSGYPWWLDVETTNTWQTGFAGQALNLAVLQGFVDGLVSAGAPSVGLYAAPNQWAAITGGTGPTTPALGELATWMPGANDEAGTQSVCADTSFTGGPVALAQFPAGGYDGDLPCAPPTDAPSNVIRIYGQDAIGTSIAVSQQEFPAPGSAKAVVLAQSEFFSDALVGGPLAAAVDGPLLITPDAAVSSALDPRVQAEIERVLPSGSTVYVLGGDLALSPQIDTTLESLGYRVVRESGTNEYATAVDVAEQLGNPSTIFEATGLDFYDALSAVPAAIEEHAAILLTDGATQAPETAAYLARFPSDTRYAIGGPLAAAGADPAAKPVYGRTLFGTSAAVASTFFPGAALFGVATSEAFPDALGGGAFMATSGRSGPLLLVDPNGPLPAPVSAYLASLRKGTRGYVFGGPLAVSPAVVSTLSASVGYGSASVGYGSASVGYGSASVGYGSASVGYGSAAGGSSVSRSPTSS